MWMVVDLEADMASLRRLATKLLHEALNTGLETWSVLLVIHLVKQELHRAGVGNHEADEAAQTVDMVQERELRVPEGTEQLNMMQKPPRVGEEERSRSVVADDRGRRELRVYPQPVYILAQVRGGSEVVALSRYLEDRVWQQIHFLNLLRLETVPKRL